MTKIKPISIKGMTGLNLEHPTLIPDNAWADTQNMVQGNDGLWENRKGIKSFDNAVGSSKKVHSLHFWKPNSGGARYLTVGSGTALYSYAESVAYNDGSFTSRQTGFTDGSPFDFGQYKNNLIATNGVESMYSTTDNSTWTQRNGSNTRVAKYIHFANDTGYCADVSGARSVVYYGSTVPASPWEFANSVSIDEDNGQIITGLENLGPIIISGKQRSIYSVDIATPSREQLDYGSGLISNRSQVKAENSVYIASLEGITTLAQRQGTTGSLAANPLSFAIQTLWDQVINKDEIVGIYFPRTRRIYWGVQTSAKNYVIIYDVRFQSWSYFIGANVADFTIYEDSSENEHLIFGDINTDKIRELEHENRDDDGAPIESILLTKRYDFGTAQYKNCRYIDVYGYGSELMNLDIEIFFDDEQIASYSTTATSVNFTTTLSPSSGALAGGALASGALAGAIPSDGDLEVFPFFIRIPIERTFRTIQIKMSNSDIGVRWRFRQIDIFVESESSDLIETSLYA